MKISVDGHLNYAGRLVVGVSTPQRWVADLSREEAHELANALIAALYQRDAEVPCRFCGNGDEKCTCP